MYEFEGKKPRIGTGTYIAPSAQVIGDVVIGDGCYIGHGAVIRADYGAVRIGDGTAVEENVVIHAPPGDTCVIGSRCTLGHGAVVHGAFLGDWSVVGMNAVTSLFSRVGTWTVVAEGAVVKQRGELPDGVVAAGAPAKPVRPLREEEKEVWRRNKQLYVDLAGRYLADGMKAVAE